MPFANKTDQLLAEEEQIVECLGAAVIMRWGTLPTKIQRELFERATSLVDLTEMPQLKRQIACFLHNRRMTGFQRVTRGETKER